jgi:hypothetical protein
VAPDDPSLGDATVGFELYAERAIAAGEEMFISCAAAGCGCFY